MIITMRDLRAAKVCGRGARKFFERYGIDWRDFVKNGVDERKLTDTGDAMALHVVEVANAGRK